MSDIEDLQIEMLALAVKHGKHNQASHGRKTARRRAYSAAYSQERAGGASPADARAKAKEAGIARQSERDARLERLRGAAQQQANTPAAPRGLTARQQRDQRSQEITAELRKLYQSESQTRDRSERIKIRDKIEKLESEQYGLYRLQNSINEAAQAQIYNIESARRKYDEQTYKDRIKKLESDINYYSRSKSKRSEVRRLQEEIDFNKRRIEELRANKDRVDELLRGYDDQISRIREIAENA
jgi:hypothetical protein